MSQQRGTPPARPSTERDPASERTTPSLLRAFTVGTAGHVDHGKSALVRALTGTDPDRLPEEKARGMTIVLGFAHLQLPSGRRCYIVDVPGHESLIRTMVSGACGLDAVLLCVDAREGVMPQTREHVQILELLGVTRGIAVITKADLLETPLDRARAQDRLRAWLRGTALAHAPILLTSAQTGEGLDALVEEIDRLLQGTPPRDHAGPARMPIDRAFTVAGAGTIVTGTLWSGTLRPGMTLSLLPQDRSVRVRGLQLHGEPAEIALAGERPAVNITGIEAKEIAPGSQLVDPRSLTTTSRLTARLRLLPGSPPLRRRTTVEFLAGTASARAHLVMLDLAPGETHAAHPREPLALLRLSSPMVLAFQDTAILRTTGGERTLGAATVLDIAPPPRIRLGIETSARLATATPEEAARELARAAGTAGAPDDTLQKKLGVTPQRLAALVRSHHRYWHEDALAQAREALLQALPPPGTSTWLTQWWRASPIQDPGVLETLTRDIARVYGLRVHDGLLVVPPAPSAPVAPRALRAVERALYVDPARVVPVATLADTTGLSPRDTRRALRALIADGTAVRISDHFVCHRKVLARLVREIAALGTAPDSEIRDRLGLSRQAARDLLGYLASLGVGSRVGRAFSPIELRIRTTGSRPTPSS
jgi:selenocysteine-specific elongation factor